VWQCCNTIFEDKAICPTCSHRSKWSLFWVGCLRLSLAQCIRRCSSSAPKDSYDVVNPLDAAVNIRKHYPVKLSSRGDRGYMMWHADRWIWAMEEWWSETKLTTAADKTFEHNKLNMKLLGNVPQAAQVYEANLRVYIRVFITTRVYFHGAEVRAVHGGDEKCIQKCILKTWKERIRLGDLGIDGGSCAWSLRTEVWVMNTAVFRSVTLCSLLEVLHDHPL